MQKKRMVLYDAKCLLCAKAKTSLKKWDWLDRVQWVSLQEYEEKGKTPFQAVELRKEIHLLIKNAQEEKVLKGFLAMRAIFLQMPLTFILGLICYIPGAHIVGDPLYKWIAKNRHRFLKNQCDSESCSL